MRIHFEQAQLFIFKWRFTTVDANAVYNMKQYAGFVYSLLSLRTWRRGNWSYILVF
jgi:hypothetical protein